MNAHDLYDKMIKTYRQYSYGETDIEDVALAAIDLLKLGLPNPFEVEYEQVNKSGEHIMSVLTPSMQEVSSDD